MPRNYGGMPPVAPMQNSGYGVPGGMHQGSGFPGIPPPQQYGAPEPQDDSEMKKTVGNHFLSLFSDTHDQTGKAIEFLLSLASGESQQHQPGGYPSNQQGGFGGNSYEQMPQESQLDPYSQYPPQQMPQESQLDPYSQYPPQQEYVDPQQQQQQQQYGVPPGPQQHTKKRRWNGAGDRNGSRLMDNGNGNWTCPDPVCANINFPMRVECNRCRIPRPENTY